MGIPRRMSKKFFDEERNKLYQYRKNYCLLMTKKVLILILIIASTIWR